jgi:hypothetical protein
MQTNIEEGNRVLADKITLAEFMEYTVKKFPHNTMYVPKGMEDEGLWFWRQVQDLEYDTDRNALHEVWVKFRELKFPLGSKEALQWANHCQNIARVMAYGTLPELFAALVEAVRWWNEVKKGGNGE